MLSLALQAIEFLQNNQLRISGKQYFKIISIWHSRKRFARYWQGLNTANHKSRKRHSETKKKWTWGKWRRAISSAIAFVRYIFDGDVIDAPKQDACTYLRIPPCCFDNYIIRRILNHTLCSTITRYLLCSYIICSYSRNRFSNSNVDIIKSVISSLKLPSYKTYDKLFILLSMILMDQSSLNVTHATPMRLITTFDFAMANLMEFSSRGSNRIGTTCILTAVNECFTVENILYARYRTLLILKRCI